MTLLLEWWKTDRYDIWDHRMAFTYTESGTPFSVTCYDLIFEVSVHQNSLGRLLRGQIIRKYQV